MLVARWRERRCARRGRLQYGGRVTFEQLTAGADAEQLEFMKEQIVQVDELDNVVGPISKKDGTCRRRPCT